MIEELISSILENKEMDVISMISRPYVRSWLQYLLSVRDPLEIGLKITELYREELRNIGSLLPHKYAMYIDTFFEFFIVDEIYASLYSKSRGITGPGTDELRGYNSCITKDPFEIYICVLERIIRKINDHVTVLQGRRGKALASAMTIAMSKYIRYLENEKKIGIVRQIVSSDFLKKRYEMFKEIDEYILWRCVNILEKTWEKYSSNPLFQFINEAKEIYWFLKNELYYSNDLLSLLTFYLVTRYYEAYTLRYLVTRGLLKW
ncbi:MAG: hypothetical protein QXU13_02735 [Desulfurococcaceae archaeon]